MKIVGIATGNSHTLAWDNMGFIYSWGEVLNGKLGLAIKKEYDSTSVEYFPQRVIFNRYINKQIETLLHERIIMASCGDNHSCALTLQGDLF